MLTVIDSALCLGVGGTTARPKMHARDGSKNLSPLAIPQSKFSVVPVSRFNSSRQAGRKSPAAATSPVWSAGLLSPSTPSSSPASSASGFSPLTPHSARLGGSPLANTWFIDDDTEPTETTERVRGYESETLFSPRDDSDFTDDEEGGSRHVRSSSAPGNRGGNGSPQIKKRTAAPPLPKRPTITLTDTTAPSPRLASDSRHPKHIAAVAMLAAVATPLPLTPHSQHHKRPYTPPLPSPPPPPLPPKDYPLSPEARIPRSQLPSPLELLAASSLSLPPTPSLLAPPSSTPPPPPLSPLAKPPKAHSSRTADSFREARSYLHRCAVESPERFRVLLGAVSLEGPQVFLEHSFPGCEIVDEGPFPGRIMMGIRIDETKVYLVKRKPQRRIIRLRSASSHDDGNHGLEEGSETESSGTEYTLSSRSIENDDDDGNDSAEGGGEVVAIHLAVVPPAPATSTTPARTLGAGGRGRGGRTFAAARSNSDSDSDSNSDSDSAYTSIPRMPESGALLRAPSMRCAEQALLDLLRDWYAAGRLSDNCEAIISVGVDVLFRKFSSRGGFGGLPRSPSPLPASNSNSTSTCFGGGDKPSDGNRRYNTNVLDAAALDALPGLKVLVDMAAEEEEEEWYEERGEGSSTWGLRDVRRKSR